MVFAARCMQRLWWPCARLALTTLWWWFTTSCCIRAAGIAAGAHATTRPCAAGNEAHSASLFEDLWELMSPRSTALEPLSWYAPITELKAAAGRQAATSLVTWALSHSLGAR